MLASNIKILPGNEQEREFIDKKIDAYNAAQVPFTQDPMSIPIEFTAKDGDKIVGGIVAQMYGWKCLYIYVLWVDENYRYAGLGSKLITTTEAYAKEQGCYIAHLDTFDFQAKDFYLKHGYEVFGELKDCPPGHSRYYLKKNFS